MSTKEDGGPAFPASDTYTNRDGDVTTTIHDGMTLRDYFAAKAMPMLLHESIKVHRDGLTSSQTFSVTAEMAYEMADAMLEARKS